STHNTPIERLWVEVGSQFARPWRGFFLRLERLHRLDRDNPHHLWLLHKLFLPQLNEDCIEFQNDWNHHPISGKGRNQTPLDKRLIGELKYGRYTDNFENIHPEILARYDNFGKNLLSNFTLLSLNHTQDDLDAAIADDQGRNVRHDPIEVPKHTSPFLTAEGKEIFNQALEMVQAEDIIPSGFGVAEGEWEDGIYPEIEVVKVGRKDSEVELPFVVWWPRAVAWARGLELMVQIQAVENGDTEP
ncbi:hypothetical protein B0H11DRAFT_1720371, partial [Mycena galericulata]